MARKNGQLTAKESAAIEFYCNPDSESFNNWCKSYTRAGYSDCNNYQANAKKVYDKDMVQAGIEAYKVKRVNKTAWTFKDSQDKLLHLADLAEGNKQYASAVSAIVSVNRMNAWDKDTQANPDQPLDLSTEQLADLNRKANLALATDDRQQEAG